MSEFEQLARQLIDYLNKNHHPHTLIVIDCNSAQLLEGLQAFTTNEYIRD